MTLKDSTLQLHGRGNTFKFTSALTTVCVTPVKIDVVLWFSLQSLIRCLVMCLCVVER